MQPGLLKLFSELAKQNIVVDPATLKLNEAQGYMSKVFIANSTAADLIIHIQTPTPEQIRQQSWEKAGLAHTLLQNTSVPTARVFALIEESGTYYSAQEKLPGKNAGARIFEEPDIVDRWDIGPETMECIEAAIAQMHSIVGIKGYGWLTKTASGAQGIHPSWRDFLESEIPLWLGSIERHEADFAQRVRQYFLPLTKHTLYEGPSALVHNDATNPSNMLVKDGLLTGIIDWEWALAGDPAWEFGYNNEYGLRRYFREMNLSTAEEKDFRIRMEFCKNLFLLWAMHVHSSSKNNLIYKVLKTQLLKAVS